MASKGQQTRENIMGTAQSLILKRGYAGTSIDDIIGEAGITKGGFFYHFDGKNDLARCLVRRYLDQDAEFFDSIGERACSLSEDPLQQFLIFLKLMAEAMENLPGAHPGCLVASFAYQSHLFDDEVRELYSKGMMSWRTLFLEYIEKAAAQYEARTDMPLEELADNLIAAIEGGILMSRVLGDRKILSRQLLQYRHYVRLVFGDLR
jgi:AcrR family transcriptional regulator